MSSYKNKQSIIKFQTPILSGSITQVFITCGKKSCLCRSDKSQRHGPYWQWTGFIEGTRTTRMIPEDKVKHVTNCMKNYAKLMKAIEVIKNRSLKNPPWE